MNRSSTFDDENGPVLLLSANSVWNVRHYRMNLLRALQRAGYRIVVAAPTGPDAPTLEAEGVRFVPLRMSPTGTSPLEDAALLGRYVRLLNSFKPAAFLGFTAKPNIYGSLAAQLCGVPAIANLTGLGTAFIHGRPLERVLSWLYEIALRRAEAVFFHNPDDRELFIGRGLVRPDRALVLPGSGIDLEHFTAASLPSRTLGTTFLFVGRLLWEKGAGEFAEAAGTVKKAHPLSRFQILGSFGEGKRAVPKQQVEQWEQEGTIEYLPPCTDIRPLIAASDCVVLPSYREGLPRVLLEAAAMGRPAVASDVPGCRHAVLDGITGYLCEVRSSEALAEAMMRMIHLPRVEFEQMAARARAHAEEHFGDEKISVAYLSVLSRIAARQGRR